MVFDAVHIEVTCGKMFVPVAVPATVVAPKTVGKYAVADFCDYNYSLKIIRL